MLLLQQHAEKIKLEPSPTFSGGVYPTFITEFTSSNNILFSQCHNYSNAWVNNYAEVWRETVELLGVFSLDKWKINDWVIEGDEELGGRVWGREREILYSMIYISGTNPLFIQNLKRRKK